MEICNLQKMFEEENKMTGAKILVDINIKQLVHKEHLQCTSDFCANLEKYVVDVVHSAIQRAKDNQRTTLMIRDIPFVLR